MKTFRSGRAVYMDYINNSKGSLIIVSS